ncbi:hypothetical protein [Streptomyces sp. NPDC102360]|uniref:hypothetical protein n=1 Tax=Streptomyces sp. NPDC102360 TaxID=3366160 RepID=UPI0037F4B2A5
MAHCNDDHASVLADGTAYDVHARLTSHTTRITARAFNDTTTEDGLTDWYGTIDITDDTAVWAISQADEPKLRLANGEERTFFVADSTPDGTGLSIRGNGSVPFGD